jgi:hypothetical protein
MWSMILQTCADDRPQRCAVIRELSDPIKERAFEFTEEE